MSVSKSCRVASLDRTFCIFGIDAQLGLAHVEGELKKVAEVIITEKLSVKNISAFFSVGYRF